MAGRPLGVTIIAILGFIGAVIEVMFGIFLLGVGTILLSFLGPLSFLGATAGAIFLIIGVVQFIISYGLWKMRKWGLYIELILLVIGIIFSVVVMTYTGDITQILSIIISAIIFYYLYSRRKLFS